ncbi:MAG: hypothetical protein FWB96_06545 [Defluviitaleaceae bacterium]|nr:hypothetical protein [Defluviitaleaceae bacterium]MCL2263829.1 hypothetical protein [Defluviitaleaceae bacterium]
MTNLDNLTDEQKQAEIQAAQERNEKMLLRGKCIVITVAVLVILGAAYNVAGGLSFPTVVGAVVNIGCAVALLNGHAFARWFFIVVFVLGALFSLFTITLVEMSRIPRPTQTVTEEFREEFGMYVPVIHTHQPEPPQDLESVTVLYLTLAGLSVLYIVGAVVLFKSESVKEYMYSVRYA